LLVCRSLIWGEKVEELERDFENVAKIGTPGFNVVKVGWLGMSN